MDPLVFISYTSTDRERVSKYYEYLLLKGFNVWIDHKKLKAGQNWDFEIRRALSKASIIIIFISNNSVTKRGYIQREIKLALNKYEEKLSDDIYVVPVVLDDDVSIPEILQDVQFVRESKGNCEEEIEESIRYQLDQLGVDIRHSQDSSNLSWSALNYRDLWDGLPGYEIDIGFLIFSSEEYSRVSDISDYIRGFLIGDAMRMRGVKFEIDLERYNYGQNRQSRTSTYDAHCDEPNIVGKVLFINYSIHTFFSGAAHPNMNFQTFCFLLDPLIKISSLQEFFEKPDLAFAIIQQKSREILLEKLLEQSEFGENEREEVAESYKTWIREGTENWEQFDSFIMKGEKLEILFSPYQVSSYANGPQVAEIDLSDLVEFMKPHLFCALEMEFLSVRRSWSETPEPAEAVEVSTPPPPA